MVTATVRLPQQVKSSISRCRVIGCSPLRARMCFLALLADPITIRPNSCLERGKGIGNHYAVGYRSVNRPPGASVILLDEEYETIDGIPDEPPAIVEFL